MTGNAVPPGTSSKDLREAAVRAMNALMQSVEHVRGDLHDYGSVIKAARDDLASGLPVGDMIARHQAGAVRASISDRLNEIERARAESRLTLWQLQLSDGSTIADIARAWGYSRQLVSRALADPNRAAPPGPDETPDRG